jgi:type IV secretion system protein VirB1
MSFSFLITGLILPGDKMLSTTAFVALAMQCAASIHPDTAQEVARVESGFNPYAIAEIIPKNERKEGDSGVISYFLKQRRTR